MLLLIHKRFCKMKKISLMFLSIFVLILSSCGNSNTQENKPTDGNKDIIESREIESNKRYEIDLTIDNFWRYFSNDRTEYTSNGSSAKITYENQGILNFAYYENVIFTLEISYQYKNTGTWPYKEAEGKLDTINLEMKANGYGSYIYNYAKYQSVFESLPSYNQYYVTSIVNVVNVSGKVVFSI